MLNSDHFWKCTPEMYPQFLNVPQISKYATDGVICSACRICWLKSVQNVKHNIVNALLRDITPNDKL